MRTRGGIQISVWIAMSSGLLGVSRPAGHPLCCLLQYSWLLWSGCHLCLLPCWCLEIVWPLWFLDLWLLASGSLWGIIDDFQVLSGHLLHSVLQLGIQWSLDCYLYLPIICKWSKHCLSGGFFCLPGWFSGVWRTGLHVSNHQLPSLGPCRTRNSYYTDLKSQRSQCDNLRLLPTHDANPLFPACKAHCYIWPSSKGP